MKQEDQEETIILPRLPGFSTIGDRRIDMPCFLSPDGKISLYDFEDMATHYIQSYLYRTPCQSTN